MREDNLNRELNQKRGQVTLFIIIGILIVSVILVFYFWVYPTYITGRGAGLGFESCVEEVLDKKITELAPKAGFANPEFFYKYQGDRIPYLCYTNKFYITCTVQKPFFKQHFEDNLEFAIGEETNDCYSNSINELKGRGYDVQVTRKLDYEVILEPGVARVKIDAPTTVGSTSLARFDVRLNSPIYDMLFISTSILQYESELGDSDTTRLTDFYPEYTIDKLKQGDGTTVYILTSKIHGTQIKFASRSLAWPAGYDV
tara:strand:+ start:2039 stop:2809 length:771 start_codon:yes stop_codon:yes gene_type:complete